MKNIIKILVSLGIIALGISSYIYFEKQDVLKEVIDTNNQIEAQIEGLNNSLEIKKEELLLLEEENNSFDASVKEENDLWLRQNQKLSPYLN